MTGTEKDILFESARVKFLALSLESTRKSYYPQLKQQLELSKENERRLQLLIDSMPARISFVDMQERYVFVNRGYEKAFALPRDKIVGRRVEAIVGSDNYAKVKEHIHQALGGSHVHFEATFIGLHQETQWLDITYVPDIDAQGTVNGFYVLGLDITDKKRGEEERLKLETTLRQIQKREAIGTLAGGIAHDFNNLLMGIQGLASLMSMDLDASHPHKEHLQAMEEYIRSAMDLTKQLLGFARGGKYEVKPTDINELILNSATMFGRTRKEIIIHKEMASTTLVVDVDRNQIEQVLLNMFVNAWQAMPDGGDLYLESRRVELDESFSRLHGLTPGPFAKISVTDTGCGMDEATRQRVFDPFFTTREKSRGTGMGLASAFGIIQNHGGLITVYSEVGRGTTFNIYLPLSDKEAQPETSFEERVIKGSETILLVDDEMMILKVGQAMLQRLGYRTMIASGGKQALEIIATRGVEIDMVILDLIMPGMDGGRTFDHIREIKPQLPVLLSSGYAINGKAHEIMQRGCTGFIQKPFNISELSQKIRGILDKAAK
jgi:two-component system cell cycle sensor histidine kinase/response regulator CckA